MKFQAVFFGPDDKLRSGWRFGIFACLFMVSTIALSLIGSAILFALPTAPSPAVTFVSSSLSGLVPALLLGWLCGKWLEGLPFRALGAWFTGGWGVHILLGLAIGAMTLALAIGIASVFGDLDFSFNSGADSAAIVQTLVTSFIVFAFAAAFEEVLFRGYILQTFARSGLAFLAILLTSIFFGIVHLGNPNVSYLGAMNTAIAGVWFGIAYLKTRDLWFVWGMHLMWNWMQGAVFGIEVSGLTDIVHSPLLKETDGGPAWLTGGDYGIEGSVACTIALVISTVAVHFLPLKADEEMLALTSPPPTVTTSVS
jgi:membrane protease YdiL (CAAX protease family)